MISENDCGRNIYYCDSKECTDLQFLQCAKLIMSRILIGHGVKIQCGACADSNYVLVQKSDLNETVMVVLTPCALVLKVSRWVNMVVDSKLRVIYNIQLRST